MYAPTFFNQAPGISLRPVVTASGPPIDLRAFGPSDLFAQGMFAMAGGSPFRFDQGSYATDNGTTVIKPDDIDPANGGRWVVIGGGGGGGPLPSIAWELSGPYGALEEHGSAHYGNFGTPAIPGGNLTIVAVMMTRRTAGASGNTIVDVLKNGTTIFGSLTKPIIPAGAGDYATSYINTFDPVGVNVLMPNDMLDVVLFDIETPNDLGLTIGPEGLRVQLLLSH